VLSGFLQVVRSVQRKEPYTGLFWDVVAVLGPGEWIGEASLLTGAPRNATVVAESEALLAEIPKAGFEASSGGSPMFWNCLRNSWNPRHRPADAPSETGRHLARQLWVRQIRTWFGLG